MEALRRPSLGGSLAAQSRRASRCARTAGLGGACPRHRDRQASRHHLEGGLNGRSGRFGGGLGRTFAGFGSLSSRLDDTWRKLQGIDKLTSENLKEPLKEIRRALLEADVSLPVVRKFIKAVEAKATGSAVLKGLEPDQQLVKIVKDELVDLMGSENKTLEEADEGQPQVLLMLGLQGVGKTTTCAKLANLLKPDRSVCLVAADTYRPAAVDQLKKLGAKIDVPVFSKDPSEGASPVAIVEAGLEFAREGGYKSVIVDTAGRLQIDETMMEELRDIKRAIEPTDALLVVDAMTGQEAAGLVKTFDEQIGLTGAILSKADGDSRGGAALSMKAVTGKPVKFVSNGEKMTDLSPFYPDRMASRILGMGDVMTLIEKIEGQVKEDEVERLQERIMEAKFDFNDFEKQLDMMRGMGALGQTMRLIPGLNKMSDKQMMQAEKTMSVTRAVIKAMTDDEKANPDMVARSPEIKRRLAKTTGEKVATVEAIMAQFLGMRKQMQKLPEMLSAREELSGLVGEEALANMKDLPAELLKQEQVGRKVSKGKVLRKKAAAQLAPAKGFGKR